MIFGSPANGIAKNQGLITIPYIMEFPLFHLFLVMLEKILLLLGMHNWNSMLHVPIVRMFVVKKNLL